MWTRAPRAPRSFCGLGPCEGRSSCTAPTPMKPEQPGQRAHSRPFPWMTNVSQPERKCNRSCQEHTRASPFMSLACSTTLWESAARTGTRRRRTRSCVQLSCCALCQPWSTHRTSDRQATDGRVDGERGFCFSHTSTFQLLYKPWSQVSSLLPLRFLPSMFYRA